MARGIRAGDRGKHLITFHPTGGAGSSQVFHNEDWLDFNTRQNGHTPEFTGHYEATRADYDLAPHKPVLDGEPIYEDHPVSFNAAKFGHSIASDVRRPLYWDLFTGAFGQTYGHHSVWQMWKSVTTGTNDPLLPWSEAIVQNGALQMKHGRALIESRPFFSRIPDQDILVENRVRTSVPGAGCYSFVATRDTDGTYAMVYSPVGRAFTVRMDSIRGPIIKASWFNPRDGLATPIGEFPNTSEKEFTPPNPGEMLDWVLVQWIHLPDQEIIVGFAGKTLFGMDGPSGATLWQKRGWTDANVTVVNGEVYVLRGDGVVARVRIERDGIQILNAAVGINDRVWAPLVVSRGRYLVRGRASLGSDALDALPAADVLPEGTAVTSMDAMYGEPDEHISDLIARASAMPSPLTWEKYMAVANDASLQLGQGTYQSIIKALMNRDDKSLARRIATDWHERMPDSIEAWERLIDMLEQGGEEQVAALERHQRMLEVQFEFEVPSTAPADAALPESRVVVFGNATALGNWKGPGLVLEPVSDTLVRGSAVIPKGNLRFALALGSMDRVEVRPDNRSISNRRQRLQGPTVIRGTVARWKAVP